MGKLKPGNRQWAMGNGFSSLLPIPHSLLPAFTPIAHCLLPDAVIFWLSVDG